MKQQTQRKINEALRHIRHSNKSGSHVNCIRLNYSAADKHNDEIIRRCVEYLKTGVSFITEAHFIHGGRADLINLATKEIIEICNTETEIRFKEKIKSYPDIFTIRKIRI